MEIGIEMVENHLKDDKRRSHLIRLLQLLVTLSTVYDLIIGTHRVPEEVNLHIKLIKCFSVVQNYKSLTKYSPINSYPFLYFLKVVFMSIVIWGHAMIIFYTFPKYETEEMEVAYRPWSIELISDVVLNPFFMMSGFLKAFHFNFSPENEGNVKFFARSFAMKWLRMVPVNGLMILYFFFLLPYLEDAPLSSHIKLMEVKYCSSNWWTNMLAIQNFVNYREICHPHSWYIAVDTQLFVMGTVLLMIFRKNKKHGIYLMTLTSLYSVLHTFVKFYSNDSGRLFTGLFNGDIMNYRDSVATLFETHTVTFLRVGPYLVGHVTAIITKALMKKSYKFSRMQSIFLICGSFLIGFGSQLYGFQLYVIESQKNNWRSAAFAVLAPILFVLPFASLICVYFTSGLGILKPIFELKIFIFLGRLSYSFYLVGFGMQSYHVFNQKRILSGFRKIEMYWWIIGDFFFVLLFALSFYFTCEAPANRLIDLFITPYLVKKKTGLEEKSDCETTDLRNCMQLHPNANASLRNVDKESVMRKRKTKGNNTATSLTK